MARSSGEHEDPPQNGKKYSSGTKVPGQILAIAQMLNDKYGIDVKDKGTGRGGMTIYENGKPVG